MQETTAAQQEIIESRLITLGFNSVISLPTGSGKTWVAQEAIKETIQGGKRTIYLSPLRALARELYERWKVQFAPKSC
ncbi:MAG TPA: hypothetical protein DCE56_39620 [Cyanobacteria bacterium UBA8553]|nr:hypothetical protein [Cyanobacteria bacterium UBA8553]HAJ63368.1 hypothetical protein [Cyanobacteria bacterium UBA8543]